MSEEKVCQHCGKPLPAHANSACSWECHVELARADGGVEHCPNGLPVRCLRWDGLMTECGHGDHATYMFPVQICHYVPNHALPDDHDEDYDWPPRDTAALIYTDGCIAVTLYECCYDMWLLFTGECLGGYHAADYMSGYFLAPESIEKILALNITRKVPPLRERE